MVDALTALFSARSDDWATPRDLFDRLDAEFHFDLDAAACPANNKCLRWLGPESDEAEDALAVRWDNPPFPATAYLNPPYSRCRAFIGKAATEARAGRAMVVCLVPARTDTRWFHRWVYDELWHRARPGVEIRFLSGRVKFGGPTKSGKPQGATFPSMIVVFRRWPMRDGADA